MVNVTEKTGFLKILVVFFVPGRAGGLVAGDLFTDYLANDGAGAGPCIEIDKDDLLPGA